jgi:extracellular elastinolytic metalloproteinase
MAWRCELPLPIYILLHNHLPLLFTSSLEYLLIHRNSSQPCSPNFVQARDAIIDADTALTGGVNKCDIWKGFAKRGLGTGAKYSSSSRTASTAVPAGC